MASYKLMLTAVAALFLVSLSSVSGLECYQCHGCEEGQRGHPIECSRSQTACMKIVMGSRIEKSCSQSSTCQLGDFEKTLTNVFSDLSSAISGNEVDSDPSAKVIHCCNEDYCNTATTSTVTSALLVISPLLLAVLAQ